VECGLVVASLEEHEHDADERGDPAVHQRLPISKVEWQYRVVGHVGFSDDVKA
jgi:hypothetical protein